MPIFTRFAMFVCDNKLCNASEIVPIARKKPDPPELNLEAQDVFIFLPGEDGTIETWKIMDDGPKGILTVDKTVKPSFKVYCPDCKNEMETASMLQSEKKKKIQ